MTPASGMIPVIPDTELTKITTNSCGGQPAFVSTIGSTYLYASDLWNNGNTHDYRRNAAPLQPEANFVRTVDYCASAFLLVQAALLTQLDGFDHDCKGHASQDTTLGLRGED